MIRLFYRKNEMDRLIASLKNGEGWQWDEFGLDHRSGINFWTGSSRDVLFFELYRYGSTRERISMKFRLLEKIVLRKHVRNLLKKLRPSGHGDALATWITEIEKHSK